MRDSGKAPTNPKEFASSPAMRRRASAAACGMQSFIDQANKGDWAGFVIDIGGDAAVLLSDAVTALAPTIERHRRLKGLDDHDEGNS